MIDTQRNSNRAPTIDLSALKYIRLVVASYVMAIAFGIINGFDPNLYFSNFLPHPISLYVSKVFVVFCALMLFFGYFIRAASLYLSIVIFASSFQENFIFPVSGSIEALFTDLLLVGGLLSCYGPLSARQLRKQAVFGRWQRKVRIDRFKKARVTPRRVTCSHPVRGRTLPNTTEMAVKGLMAVASKSAEDKNDPIHKLTVWEEDLQTLKEDLQAWKKGPENIFA